LQTHHYIFRKVSVSRSNLVAAFRLRTFRTTRLFINDSSHALVLVKCQYECAFSWPRFQYSVLIMKNRKEAALQGSTTHARGFRFCASLYVSFLQLVYFLSPSRKGFLGTLTARATACCPARSSASCTVSCTGCTVEASNRRRRSADLYAARSACFLFFRIDMKLVNILAQNTSLSGSFCGWRNMRNHLSRVFFNAFSPADLSFSI